MNMTLLPAAPGTCPLCARDHAADWPHDNQSLYYQMRFKIRHGRFPTWADALAHCSDEMQDMWRQELAKRGVTVGPIDATAVIAEPGGTSTCD